MSKPTQWDKALLDFKTAEAATDAKLRHADIVPIAQNPRLGLILAAWRYNPPTRLSAADRRRNGVKARAPKKEAQRWSWLWGFVDIDHDELRNATGLPMGELRKLVTQAVSMRLVYPDGTVHELALQLVNAQMVERLGAKG